MSDRECPYPQSHVPTPRRRVVETTSQGRAIDDLIIVTWYGLTPSVQSPEGKGVGE